MRVLLQRVSEAAVDVGSERVGEIGRGLLLLVGAAPDDTGDDVRYLAEKITNLRIFADDDGKMNRSALDYGYELLVVSQFTLHANVRKGRRPSFIGAAGPEIAEPLVESLVAELRSTGLGVETGCFGAEMAVSLVNDGPVTIWLDTGDLRG
ncbi:MAG: D-tyrosyl-tRNA(Tyr) deacylase [Chloroflexia bacterium]|jgi:D-tyrosyl-tRNA(Tyr) deacylase|nr:D-tyrosyl-tRNA(Tyr) deacylase [Chloroflexia bacterium]